MQWSTALKLAFTALSVGQREAAPAAYGRPASSGADTARLGHMDIEQSTAQAGELPDSWKPHFQGDARMQDLTSPFSEGPDVFFVHFDAGGRPRPHTHRAGQVLHIVSGEGIVADGDGRRQVRTGDTVVVRPDEWHWHGGSPTSAMSHLTIQFAGDVVWDVDERDWADNY